MSLAQSLLSTLTRAQRDHYAVPLMQISTTGILEWTASDYWTYYINKTHDCFPSNRRAVFEHYFKHVPPYMEEHFSNFNQSACAPLTTIDHYFDWEYMQAELFKSVGMELLDTVPDNFAAYMINSKLWLKVWAYSDFETGGMVEAHYYGMAAYHYQPFGLPVGATVENFMKITKFVRPAKRFVLVASNFLDVLSSLCYPPIAKANAAELAQIEEHMEKELKEIDKRAAREKLEIKQRVETEQLEGSLRAATLRERASSRVGAQSSRAAREHHEIHVREQREKEESRKRAHLEKMQSKEREERDKHQCRERTQSQRRELGVETTQESEISQIFFVYLRTADDWRQV